MERLAFAVMMVWGSMSMKCSAFIVDPPAKLTFPLSSRVQEDIEDDRQVVIDPDLRPPPVNVRKESILFSDSPATVENNNSLRLWKAMKEKLPYIFTGSRNDTTADENPMGGIYNVAFVRFPTILMGFVYSKNLLDGHGLVVDLGLSGPFEVNPLVVAGALYIILR